MNSKLNNSEQAPHVDFIQRPASNYQAGIG